MIAFYVRPHTPVLGALFAMGLSALMLVHCSSPEDQKSQRTTADNKSENSSVQDESSATISPDNTEETKNSPSDSTSTDSTTPATNSSNPMPDQIQDGTVYSFLDFLKLETLYSTPSDVDASIFDDFFGSESCSTGVCPNKPGTTCTETQCLASAVCTATSPKCGGDKPCPIKAILRVGYEPPCPGCSDVDKLLKQTKIGFDSNFEARHDDIAFQDRNAKTLNLQWSALDVNMASLGNEVECSLERVVNNIANQISNKCEGELNVNFQLGLGQTSETFRLMAKDKRTITESMPVADFAEAVSVVVTATAETCKDSSPTVGMTYGSNVFAYSYGVILNYGGYYPSIISQPSSIRDAAAFKVYTTFPPSTVKFQANASLESYQASPGYYETTANGNIYYPIIGYNTGSTSCGTDIQFSAIPNKPGVKFVKWDHIRVNRLHLGTSFGGTTDSISYICPCADSNDPTCNFKANQYSLNGVINTQTGSKYFNPGCDIIFECTGSKLFFNDAPSKIFCVGDDTQLPNWNPDGSPLTPNGIRGPAWSISQ